MLGIRSIYFKMRGNLSQIKNNCSNDVFVYLCLQLETNKKKHYLILVLVPHGNITALVNGKKAKVGHF